MLNDEMEKARKNAWSVEPRNPEDLEYIGMEVINGRMFMYYKNKDGYWYKSKNANNASQRY